MPEYMETCEGRRERRILKETRDQPSCSLRRQTYLQFGYKIDDDGDDVAWKLWRADLGPTRQVPVRASVGSVTKARQVYRSC
jgi:hypothetical protein